jgi:hypothetical protein
MELSPSPGTQLVDIFLTIYELAKIIALFTRALSIMGHDRKKMKINDLF